MRSSRKIYVSTSCIDKLEPLETRLSSYFDFDLRHIELGAQVKVNHDPILEILDQPADYLIHNYFPPPITPFVLNLASGNETLRNQSIKFVAETISLSAKLGAPFYSIHAGFISDPRSFELYLV